MARFLSGRARRRPAGLGVVVGSELVRFSAERADGEGPVGDARYPEGVVLEAPVLALGARRRGGDLAVDLRARDEASGRGLRQVALELAGLEQLGKGHGDISFRLSELLCSVEAGAMGWDAPTPARAAPRGGPGGRVASTDAARAPG